MLHSRALQSGFEVCTVRGLGTHVGLGLWRVQGLIANPPDPSLGVLSVQGSWWSHQGIEPYTLDAYGLLKFLQDSSMAARIVPSGLGRQGRESQEPNVMGPGLRLRELFFKKTSTC